MRLCGILKSHFPVLLSIEQNRTFRKLRTKSPYSPTPSHLMKIKRNLFFGIEFEFGPIVEYPEKPQIMIPESLEIKKW
jgi:hypothetical protein